MLSPAPFVSRTRLSIAIALASGFLAIPAVSASTKALPKVDISADHLQDYVGNRDLVRSEDDIQPYVVITRETIETSGATSVEDLLGRVLSMNTSVENQSASGWTGTSSQLNLRGLGASHTLVLINGRRGAGIGSRGVSEASDQVNINGIPLAAIERIEVLPTSASAIYGSNALGGVINVVLRRDFVGTEVNLRYDNTFDTDQGIKTLDITTGFALEEGRTQVLLSAQKKTTNALLVRDRDFAETGRANVLANNPDAIYGMNGRNTVQPPHGNLVNIRSVNGSPLLPDVSDASFAYLPAGYQGAAIDGTDPLHATLGQYALGLSNGIGSYSGVGNLIGEADSESLLLTVNRAFSETLNLFAEGGIDRNSVESSGNYHGFGVVTVPATAANNPFGQAIYVAYPANYADGKAQQQRLSDLETTRAALGFNWAISPAWNLVGDYSYSNARNDLSYQRRSTANTTAYNRAINNGSLDVLRDVTSLTTNIDPYWSIARNFSEQEINEVTLRLNGTLAKWYAGDIRLAAGIENRLVDSLARSETSYINDPTILPADRAHDTLAYYSELSVPLVSPAQEFTWLNRAELQVALRHESFDVKATPAYAPGANVVTSTASYDATSPTIGISVEPIRSLTLRASYSEGFITPTVSQISEPSLGTSLTTISDPLRGGEEVQLYVTGGGNPDITPESATSKNVGVVWVPEQWVRGLRVSVDYFDIQKENNITTIGTQNLVNNEDRFGDRVVRGDALNDGYAVGPIVEIYNVPMNTLWLKTRGIDTNITYSTSTPVGELTGTLGYTWTDHYARQDSFDASPASYVREFDSDGSGALEHRFNAGLHL